MIDEMVLRHVFALICTLAGIVFLSMALNMVCKHKKK